MNRNRRSAGAQILGLRTVSVHGGPVPLLRAIGEAGFFGVLGALLTRLLEPWLTASRHATEAHQAQLEAEDEARSVDGRHQSSTVIDLTPCGAMLLLCAMFFAPMLITRHRQTLSQVISGTVIVRA